MRFANVRDFRANISSVLDRSGGRDTVIVTLRGKPIALFVPVKETQIEEIMQAVRSAQIRASMDELRTQARASGSHRLKEREIEKEIKFARKSKRA